MVGFRRNLPIAAGPIRPSVDDEIQQVSNLSRMILPLADVIAALSPPGRRAPGDPIGAGSADGTGGRRGPA
jgi:2-keto-4-pentenoate hydratase/2-oxohepta-3-ene-1,7-dioic acid hydratase in catechol pathway